MESSNIAVVLAADDAYVRQLAAAARSVIDNLADDRTLTLWVLDMGIADANRFALERSLADSRVEVVRIDSLQNDVVDLPNTWTQITRATYARLFIPGVLADTPRALYLDCDVIARRCVGDLFFSDMNGAAALGTPDVQAPFVSSPYGVPNWFDAGRSADDLNFNASVMLMDLELWRQEHVTDEALKYLTDGRHHFAQDQEALNAVLPDRIGEMDPRWNQQSEIFWPEFAVIQKATKQTVDVIKADPWIIHFGNQPKPWHYGCEHPFRAEWFKYLDQTEFAGWRPSGPTRAQRLTKRTANAARQVGRKVGLLARQ